MLGVDIVGPAETESLGAVGRDFHAVHGEIEVAPLQARDQALEIVLMELDAAAQLLFQGCGQVHFEADVVIRVAGVFADVGGAALGVGGPSQRRRRRGDRVTRMGNSGCADAGQQQNEAGMRQHILHAHAPSQRGNQPGW